MGEKGKKGCKGAEAFGSLPFHNIKELEYNILMMKDVGVISKVRPQRKRQIRDGLRQKQYKSIISR